MDSFFGIGFPELVVILLLAGLVMGPQRIRQVARTLGRFIGQIQAISRQFTRQLNSELDAMDSEELKGALQDVKDLQRQMSDLQNEVRSASREFVREGEKAVKEGERAFKPRNEVPPEAAEDPDDVPPVPLPEDLPQPIDVPDDPE